jgi:acyl-CoA thioester hydrolase
MPAHAKRIEIRWRDLDGFGHVNNAVFLTYLEEARDEWLARNLNDPVGGEYMIVRVAIDYRSQVAIEDEWVDVEVSYLRAGRSSITLAERVLAGAERRLAAESETVAVRYDWEAGAARPIDPALVASLAASTAETSAQAASAAASGDRPSARPSA